MSVIKAIARKQQQLALQNNPNQPNSQEPSPQSPVKTVLGALVQKHHRVPDGHQTISKKSKKKKTRLIPKIPLTVEDVPFRRQDRRVLNARKKRLMDRHLIRCLVLTGIVVLLMGAAFIGTYIFFDFERARFASFIICGGVAIFLAILIFIFAVEICIRLRKNVKKVQDPDVDATGNLHHVKHWIQPELIAYGWGHSSDDEGGADDLKSKARAPDKAELAASRGGVRDNLVHPDRNGAGQGVHGGSDAEDLIMIDDDDNPHQAIALQMMNPETEEITSDIFDESLRYSNIDRPSLLIDRSSPTSQLRGNFEDHQEKIAKLFSPKST